MLASLLNTFYDSCMEIYFLNKQLTMSFTIFFSALWILPGSWTFLQDRYFTVVFVGCPWTGRQWVEFVKHKLSSQSSVHTWQTTPLRGIWQALHTFTVGNNICPSLLMVKSFLIFGDNHKFPAPIVQLQCRLLMPVCTPSTTLHNQLLSYRIYLFKLSLV